MVNEAARLLDERVVVHTDAIDLAMVLGTGLAPFRGGLVHFVDAVGVHSIVDRMREFAGKYGDRFAPPSLLVELAASHTAMHDFMKMERSSREEIHATVG